MTQPPLAGISFEENFLHATGAVRRVVDWPRILEIKQWLAARTARPGMMVECFVHRSANGDSLKRFFRVKTGIQLETLEGDRQLVLQTHDLLIIDLLRSGRKHVP